MNKQPWSLPVAVADIPETGRRFDLAADPRSRAAIAKAAGLPALPRLEVEFELTRHGRDGLRIVGRVSATVEQHCVLTLEPMKSEVEEAVDIVFAPARALLPKADSTHERTQPDEPPELLHDGVVDLGAVATEFLLLGINPYPRKPGAVFDAPKAKGENVTGNPFAALAALKKARRGQDS